MMTERTIGRIVLLATVVAGLTIAGVPPAMAADGGGTYTDTTFRFTVAMPAGWTVQQLPGFVSASAPDDVVTGSDGGSVSVTAQDVSGPRVRLEGYAELYHGSVFEQFDGVAGWSMRDTTVAGTPARVVDYDYAHERITMHTRVIIVVKDRRAYLLSASSLPMQWPGVLEAYGGMVRSVLFPWMRKRG